MNVWAKIIITIVVLNVLAMLWIGMTIVLANLTITAEYNHKEWGVIVAGLFKAAELIL